MGTLGSERVELIWLAVLVEWVRPEQTYPTPAYFSRSPLRSFRVLGRREGEWLDLVDVVYLDEFLFCSARASLQRAESPLLEAQDGSCFYCGSRVSASGTEVDHFIPWSRPEGCKPRN
jgi:hypothetical protein